jgi:hypothetical protein
MDDVDQIAPSPELIVNPDLTEMQQRHESDSNDDIDAMDVALLFNRVGSELTKIDKQGVGSGMKKVMKLDADVVFKGVDLSSSKRQHPVQTRTAQPIATNTQHSPRVPPPPPPMVMNVDSDMTERVNLLEKSIKRLESGNRAYQKIKKIKHGASYSVSSNSLKGVVKSADVLLEYVMCEVSKGVKSITIKLNED